MAILRQYVLMEQLIRPSIYLKIRRKKDEKVAVYGYERFDGSCAMKNKKLLVMICAFAAVIGVFALVNAKEKPIEYSREELAELFEKYPVSLLCKEFDEKKVIRIHSTCECSTCI